VSNDPREAAVIRSVDRAVAILDLLAHAVDLLRGDAGETHPLEKKG